jgi:putative glutamine amidotransferase
MSDAVAVGVPCFGAERAGSRRPLYGNNQTYIRALIAAGLTPLMIPPGLDSATLESLCARLDGLLLTGGVDIDPALYGEERLPACGEIDPERDTLELSLTRMALARDLPTFGICRGMQTLNVACGGALYQDINSQRPRALAHQQSERTYLAHTVMVERESHLRELLGVDELQVNSLHHQSVSRPGEGVRIVGWAPDGVAEALELPAQRFAIAVQYHPEELVESDALSRRLFSAFAQACREA